MPPTRPFPLKSGPIHVRALLHELVNVSFAAATAVLLICGTANAQGGVPLVTVATDQSSLNLSNQFGVPAGTAINQSGDFAFVGNGGTALFFRPAGATSATRVLQIGDAVPGITGSRVGGFSSTVALNASRFLLFEAYYTLTDYEFHAAVMTFDGTNFKTLVTSDDTAAGSGGTKYGTALAIGGINDSGDVSFSNTTVSTTSTVTTAVIVSTFYVLPGAATTAIRIAGTNDTPPAACTWCNASSSPYFYPEIQVPALNSQGQMLLELWGGLFIGSKTAPFLSLVPMATTGACSPQPSSTLGTSLSPLPTISGFLNDSGVVAFTNSSSSGNVAICVAPAGGAPPTAAIVSSATAPASLGGTILYPLALAFDNSGDIAFQGGISGSTATTNALLRYHQSNAQTDVIAYNCEAAPGTNGATFFNDFTGPCGSGIILALQPSDFGGVSIAKDGSVSFRAGLSNNQSGVYRQSAGNLPELIFAGPEPSQFPVLVIGIGVSASASGSIFSPAIPTKILDNDSVLFSTYLTSGPADFAVYLGMPANLQTLMSTADTLPAGARTILLSTAPKASGHFIAFSAQPAAGRRNLMLGDISSTPASITRVVSDNDPGLAAAGAASGDTIVTPNFFLNDSGQIAFETVASSESFGLSVIGFGSGTNAAWESLASTCGSIFLWSPSGGLAKVATTGDTAPGSTMKFSCVTLNSGPPSPLNHTGQVAFSSPSAFGQPSSSPLGGITTPVLNGAYLYSPGGTISEIAAANDTLPGESQATSFVPFLSLPVNSPGQVAFGAELGTNKQGFFIRNTAGTVQSVMANGDAIPNSGATFGFPHLISGLTNDGNLAFSAATSAAADGLFFAPAGGSIQTIALDGGAAPGGGTFSLVPQITSGTGGFIAGSLVRNLGAINNESDVAFATAIAGGTADSGYFRVMHGGTLQAAVLQGQQAPGGGTFNSIPSFSSFALGPDGAFAFVNILTTVGSGFREGLFVARADGTLVRVLATGDTLPVGGVATVISLADRSAAGDAGKFAFLAGIEGGPAREGIFVTAIPPGTASATITLGALQSLIVAQQPATLTATVTTSATSGTPTGTVNFFANGVSLGTGTLSGGQATLTTSSLAAGMNSILAQYDGDSKFAPGNSASLSTIVAGFAPPPAQLSFTPGQSLVIPLTLFAPAGSTMSFALSTSGLPANTTVSFDQNPVMPGPNGTTVQLTLRSLTGSNLPNQPHNSPLPFGGPVLAALLAALGAASLLNWRRPPRRRLVTCACLAIFALALVISGCGVAGSSSSAPQSSGPPPGPAAFTVTGTSGATTVSTVVHITVQ